MNWYAGVCFVGVVDLLGVVFQRRFASKPRGDCIALAPALELAASSAAVSSALPTAVKVHTRATETNVPRRRLQSRMMTFPDLVYGPCFARPARKIPYRPYRKCSRPALALAKSPLQARIAANASRPVQAVEPAEPDLKWRRLARKIARKRWKNRNNRHGRTTKPVTVKILRLGETDVESDISRFCRSTP